jgi:N-acetylmuramoyl-L-alanine amidase
MNMNISRKIIIALVLAFSLALPQAGAKSGPNNPFTVIIDPGHGGKDPGAVYKNIREKDIVLNLGLKLGEYLRESMPEVKVIYTRDKDVFVPLHQRADIANRNKADLFVSLHANYCGTPSITGTETFVLGLHRSEENLDVAKKENSVILMEEDYSSRYEGFDPNSSESYIMFEMVQDEHLVQSINLAAAIQGQFKNRAGRKDRGVKQAGFLVLRRTSMPSVLVEAGFLSNNNEALYMNGSEGQALLASAIFRAVREYKTSLDNKSGYKLTVPVKEVVLPPAQAVINEPVPTPDPGSVVFRLQLAATSKEIDTNSPVFKGLANIERLKINPVYKYFYGRTDSFEEIQQLKTRIKSLFPDAFVVAFEGDEAIPIKKALRKLKP